MPIISEKLGPNPLHRMRNRIAAEILEEQWNVNFAVNKKYLTSAQHVTFSSLTNMNDSAIAVIVGAGPSLSENLKGLVHFPDRNNVVFFCTDKAFPRIQNSAIPNYVCALNAKSPNREVCDWWKAGSTAGSTLIMPITSDPITLDGWLGKYCFINCGLPITLTDTIEKETGLNAIPGGSNVGVFSYLMATRLGFTKIVLIGMDYSFETREQVVSKYPPGEPYIIMEHRDQKGNVRWSSWDWFDSAVAFFEYARFFGKNGVRTVNCFPTGTMVNAPIPYPIETPPRYVFGQDGKLHEVLSRISKPFDGTLVHLKASAIGDINVTPEHPFLTIRLSDFNGRAWRKKSNGRGFKPEWIEAERLRVGDILLTTNVSTRPRCGGYTTTIDLRHKHSWNWKPIPHRILIDKELLWFTGIYTADGGRTSPNDFSIAFAPDDSKGIERARTCLKNKFGLEAHIREYDNHTRFNVSSASLSDTLLTWCGKDCYEKHLPPFAVGSPNALEGLLEGDGYVDKNGNHTITTVSPSLAMQTFQTLLNQFEFPYTYRRPAGNYPNGRLGYAVGWGKKNGAHHGRWWRMDYRGTEVGHGQKFFMMPIREVSQIRYTGLVHNLEVADVNSYIAGNGGAIVHNCTEGGIVYDGEFIEAMTMEEAGRALYP